MLNLAQAIADDGRTKRAVALAAGIHENNLHHIIAGRKTAHYRAALALAEALKTRLDSLVYEVPGTRQRFASRPRGDHPLDRLIDAHGGEQKAFAAKVGASENTIHQVRLGRRSMSIGMLARIATATGVSLHDLAVALRAWERRNTDLVRPRLPGIAKPKRARPA